MTYAKRQMPVIKNDKIEMPEWCELQSYELVALSTNETHIFKRTHPNEKLIIGKGKRQIRFEDQIVPRENGTNLILTQEDSYSPRREVSSFISAESISAVVCPQVSFSLPLQDYQSHSQSY